MENNCIYQSIFTLKNALVAANVEHPRWPAEGRPAGTFALPALLAYAKWTAELMKPQLRLRLK